MNIEILVSNASGIARRTNKAFIGVNNTARAIKKGYIGVNNVARIFYWKADYADGFDSYQSSDKYDTFSHTFNANVGGYTCFNKTGETNVYAYNANRVKTTATNAYASRYNPAYDNFKCLVSSSDKTRMFMAGGHAINSSDKYYFLTTIRSYNSNLAYTSPALENGKSQAIGGNVGNYIVIAAGKNFTTYNSGLTAGSKSVHVWNSSNTRTKLADLSRKVTEKYSCFVRAGDNLLLIVPQRDSKTDPPTKIFCFTPSLVRTEIEPSYISLYDTAYGVARGQYAIIGQTGSKNFMALNSNAVLVTSGKMYRHNQMIRPGTAEGEDLSLFSGGFRKVPGLVNDMWRDYSQYAIDDNLQVHAMPSLTRVGTGDYENTYNVSNQKNWFCSGYIGGYFLTCYGYGENDRLSSRNTKYTAGSYTYINQGTQMYLGFTSKLFEAREITA